MFVSGISALCDISNEMASDVHILPFAMHLIIIIDSSYNYNRIAWSMTFEIFLGSICRSGRYGSMDWINLNTDIDVERFIYSHYRTKILYALSIYYNNDMYIICTRNRHQAIEWMVTHFRPDTSHPMNFRSTLFTFAKYTPSSIQLLYKICIYTSMY